MVKSAQSAISQTPFDKKNHTNQIYIYIYIFMPIYDWKIKIQMAELFDIWKIGT